MKCDKCGADMVLKTNKKTDQKFWACPNYPECSNTKPYEQPKNVIATKASSGEYHLTPEQCRTNALDFALKWATYMTPFLDAKGPKHYTVPEVLAIAKTVEPYIFGVKEDVKK